MIYCCEHFKTLIEVKKTYGLNIRIIKLSERYIENTKKRGLSIEENELYNFIITESYSGILDNKKQSLFINYCPFCGKELRKYYSKHKFINETNHIW